MTFRSKFYQKTNKTAVISLPKIQAYNWQSGKIKPYLSQWQTDVGLLPPGNCTPAHSISIPVLLVSGSGQEDLWPAVEKPSGPGPLPRPTSGPSASLDNDSKRNQECDCCHEGSCHQISPVLGS